MHIDSSTSRSSATWTHRPPWIKRKPKKPVVCTHFQFPHHTDTYGCSTARELAESCCCRQPAKLRHISRKVCFALRPEPGSGPVPREVPRSAPLVHNATPYLLTAHKDHLHLQQMMAGHAKVQLSGHIKGSKDIKITLSCSSPEQAGKSSGLSCPLIYTPIYYRSQTHPGKWLWSLAMQILHRLSVQVKKVPKQYYLAI